MIATSAGVGVRFRMWPIMASVKLILPIMSVTRFWSR